VSRVTLVLRMISANLWCQPIRPAVTSVVFDFAGVPDGLAPGRWSFRRPLPYSGNTLYNDSTLAFMREYFPDDQNIHFRRCCLREHMTLVLAGIHRKVNIRIICSPTHGAPIGVTSFTSISRFLRLA
jgi:hypothetical protein